ncbi:phage tail fiber domain-containing protein [Klebsiella aerogenes]|uniref:phage tail fiber domain-containing protein n=1 Tax=Klebsiella aerogenes TaxID=548 RepID=UPI00069A7450|nr:phage tail fiber protein [Klebsiella aerogenes]
MSVPNQIPYNIYTANGQTTVFTYEFYIISASDLEVSINGSVVTSGYTVSGVGNKDGGDITFLTPPANGAVVMLERVVPTYRLTDYQDNGDLLADTVNKDFDRIWMAIQRAFIDLGFALTRPYFGGPFDAKGYRIANLANPVNGQDAATKSYVDSTGAANLRYTVRFPEMVEPMPGVQFRANSLQGYNAQGKPVPVFSMTDTADLALKLASFTGAGLVGYKLGLPYPADTVGRKLNNWVFVEEFADENSAAGDWSTAVKKAIKYACDNNIKRVFGFGEYTFSQTCDLVHADMVGLNIDLNSVSASDNWPSNSTAWDAKPLITFGDANTQCTGFTLHINELNGIGKADGVQPVGMGFSLCSIDIDRPYNCIRVMSNGKQTWPNASVWISGHTWRDNWIGIHEERGVSGTSPISEGWNIQIKFLWSNRYAGALMRNGSQYAKFFGCDMDYNGRWISLLGVASLTGISRGMKLTNGVTECEVMSFYSLRGQSYVALMELKSVQGGNSSYAVGDTLTGAGVSTTVTSVTTTATNSSQNNFFDLFHDFQGSPFGKISVFGGYCGGMVGGLQHTSDSFFVNSFDGNTLNLRGLGVSESGTTLALYRKAESNSAFANVTEDYVNFNRRLYMRNRLFEGTPVSTTLPMSSSAFKTVYTFADSATDKYLNEGSMYEVTVKGNYPDAWARFVIFVMGNSIRMVSDDHDTNVFAWQFSGLSLQMRQNAQSVIQIALNIRRI